MQYLNSVTQHIDNFIDDYLFAHTPVSAEMSQITHIFQTAQTFSDQWIYAPIRFVFKKMHEHVWVHLDRSFYAYLSNSWQDSLCKIKQGIKALMIALFVLFEVFAPCFIFVEKSCLIPLVLFCRELSLTAPFTAFFIEFCAQVIIVVAVRLGLVFSAAASSFIGATLNIHEFVLLARIYTITKIASAAFATHPLTALIFHGIAISACSRNADNSSFPLEDFFSRCFGVDQFIRRLSAEQLARLNMITSIAIAAVIITLTLLGAPVIFSTTCGYVTVLAAKAMIVHRHVRAKTFETLRRWEENPTAESREGRRVVANCIRDEISSLANHPLFNKSIQQIAWQLQQPARGIELLLNNTHLNSLPDVFDDPYLTNITSLNISRNNITALPSSMQCLTKLRHLDASNIQTLGEITNDFFESFPSGCMLDLTASNIPDSQQRHFRRRMTQVDYQGPQFVFSVNEDAAQIERPAQDMIKTLSRAAGKVVSLNLQTIAGSDKDIHTKLCEWIRRLNEVADARANISKSFAEKLLTILQQAETDPVFRDAFLAYLNTATDHCGDRIAVSILQMGIEYDLHQVGTRDPQTVATLLRSVYIIDKLYTVAETRALELGNQHEAIEVYLMFAVKLKESLQISIAVSDMRFEGCARLVQHDLDVAEEYIRTQLVGDDAWRWFITHEKWHRLLEAHHSAEVEQLKIVRNAALEEAMDEQGRELEALERTSVQSPLEKESLTREINTAFATAMKQIHENYILGLERMTQIYYGDAIDAFKMLSSISYFARARTIARDALRYIGIS